MAREFAGPNAEQYTAPITDYGTPITLAARVLYDRTGANQDFFGVFNTVQSGEYNWVTWNGTPLVSAGTRNSTGTSGSAQYTTGLAGTQNAWQAVAAQFITNASRKIFFNTNSTANTNTVTAVNYDELRLSGQRSGTGGFIRLADFALWDVELDADELASLSKGFKAYRVRPQSLKYYIPMVRDVIELRQGTTVTASANAPTIAVHPRVY